MEQTEEKLKLEMDITSLTREHKNLNVLINSIKSEYASTFSIVENNKKLIEEQKAYLQEIQNDIANEKIVWAQNRNEELIKLEDKKSEVQNVLNRKKELNKQEETIRQIERENEDVLNETRRLEFKLEQDKTAIEVEKNAVKSKELDISRREEKLLKDLKDFKEKVIGVLHQANEL